MSPVNIDVPRFTDGQAAGAEALNRPLTYIEEKLRALYAMVGGDTQRSAIIAWSLPCASDVSAGDLVYFDATSGVYRKALAAVKTEQSVETSISAEATAMVQGLVLSKASATSANLLTGGFYTDQVLADHCLGAGAAPGLYYLSALSAGKASLTFNPRTRQPVLTYLGSGQFSLSLFYQAHDEHEHRSFDLTAGWTSCAFDSTSPEGTTFRYNLESDTQLTGLGLEQSACSLFDSGVLVADTLYPIIDGQLWYTGSGNPSENLRLFVVKPFYRSNNVLYGISTNDPSITVSTKNGLVFLQKGSYTASIGAGSRYSVASIAGNQMVLTPSISDIVSGPGVFVSVNALGKAVVGLSSLLGTPQEAEALNYNGAQPVTDDVYTVTQFPAATNTSVVMSNNVQGVDTTLNMKSMVWLDCVSGSGTLTLMMYFVPEGSTTPAAYRGEAKSASITLTAVSDGYIQRFILDPSDALEFTGPGTLLTRVTASNPNNPIRILRMGHVVYQSSNTPTSLAPVVTVAESLTATGTAGEALAAYTVVRLQSGALRAVNNLSSSQANSALGVTSALAGSGETATYVTNGVLTGVFSELTVGSPVYIGAGGALTSVVPATPAFVQQIGVCISATAVLIDVQPAITA